MQSTTRILCYAHLNVVTWRVFERCSKYFNFGSFLSVRSQFLTTCFVAKKLKIHFYYCCRAWALLKWRFFNTIFPLAVNHDAPFLNSFSLVLAMRSVCISVASLNCRRLFAPIWLLVGTIWLVLVLVFIFDSLDWSEPVQKRLHNKYVEKGMLSKCYYVLCYHLSAHKGSEVSCMKDGS